MIDHATALTQEMHAVNGCSQLMLAKEGDLLREESMAFNTEHTGSCRNLGFIRARGTQRTTQQSIVQDKASLGMFRVLKHQEEQAHRQSTQSMAWDLPQLEQNS